MQPPASERPRLAPSASAAPADSDLWLEDSLRAALVLDPGEERVLDAARLPETVLRRIREGGPAPDLAPPQARLSLPVQGSRTRLGAWLAGLAAVLLPAWSLGQTLAVVQSWVAEGLLPGPGWLAVDLASWLLRPLLESAVTLAKPASPWLVLLALGLPVVAAAAGHGPGTGTAATQSGQR